MLADLVVLSHDIFEMPTETLASVSVAVTVFDGKIVHRQTPRTETELVPSLQH
jgi:predicted amidohydrolase YtcJ